MSITPEEALRLYRKYGTIRSAARHSGIPRTTFRRRLAAANGTNNPSVPKQQKHNLLTKQIADLKRELRKANEYKLTLKEVREYIFKLKCNVDVVPRWLDTYHTGPEFTSGVPSLLLSDFHWSEVVDPQQIFFKNKYDLDVAERRLENITLRTIHILKECITANKYPGIVINLGGDMISGDIHDELTVTNDKPIMPTFIDLYTNMVRVLTRFAEEFGKVFVPCVNGNHSRTTKKIPAKDRAYTNFDWLLYHMLAKYFEDDHRVTFYIGDGGDVQYKVYGHIYRLTHGDQFRGGSGLLGLVAPVMRGEFKKRTASTSYNYRYDTLLMGHFHQYMTLGNVIVNGSLVGYNEYAMLNNFPFDIPKQALWITNKDYGITLQVPVIAKTECDTDSSTDWVSIPGSN